MQSNKPNDSFLFEYSLSSLESATAYSLLKGDEISVDETQSLTPEPTLVSTFSEDSQDCSMKSRFGNIDIRFTYTDDSDEDYGDHYTTYRTSDKIHRNKMFAMVPYRLLPFLICWTIVICFILCCDYIVNDKASSSVWRIPRKHRGALRLAEKIEKFSTPNQLTVLLRGGRLDLLHRSIDKLALCDKVASIHVIWDSDFGSFPNTLSVHRSGKVLDASKTRSVSTDAVFLLDESVRLSCEDLYWAFKEWKMDPMRIVGFHPNGNYAPDYSIVSDHAAIVHRYFWNSRPATNDLCEHYALSVYLEAVSGKSPVTITTENMFPRKLERTILVAASRCKAMLSQAAGINTPPIIRSRIIRH